LTILVNGKSNTQTSALDRGLLYGQNVFETIAIANDRAYLLDEHLERLQRGAHVLGIPLDTELLRGEITQIVQGQKKSVLRITVSIDTPLSGPPSV